VIEAQHSEGRTAAASAHLEKAQGQRDDLVLGHALSKRAHHAEGREPSPRGVPARLVVVDRREQGARANVGRGALDRRGDRLHPIVVLRPPRRGDEHHERRDVHRDSLTNSWCAREAVLEYAPTLEE
jgi:hypothetical protein